MKLLLDVGNTRLKWCVAEQGRLGDVVGHDYRQTDCMQTLRHHWETLQRPDHIAIAAVSQAAVIADLIQLLRAIWPGCNPIMARSSQAAFGVINGYAQPEKLGVDRWLALLAAHHYYSGPVCVIDCGTAITVDAVTQEGTHLGGLICPGLQMMKQALANNTAALSISAQPGETCLALDTQTAIANGCLVAALGLIEQVLLQLGAKYRLILTGGDAQFLANALSRPMVLDTALVLKGLALYCQRELP